MAAGFNREDYSLLSGASVRMAIDVGGWDNSRVINSPGQSGDPQSPFYANLTPFWAAGDYVPLLFSKAAILQATSVRIRLTPAGAHE
jgi:penicillin amidase